MVPDFKNILFPLVDSFQAEGGIEWAAKLKELNQEELVDALENVHETVKNISYHAALLPGIDEAQREKLIGRLIISAAHLFHIPGRFDNSKLEKAVKDFEDALRAITQTNWITLAKERYDEFEKFYEKAEEGEEITPEQIDFLRPVFYAFDLFEIVTFEPEAEDEEFEEEIEFDIEEDEDEQ